MVRTKFFPLELRLGRTPSISAQGGIQNFGGLRIERNANLTVLWTQKYGSANASTCRPMYSYIAKFMTELL